MCSTVGAEASNSCPASEWYAIRDWFSALNQTPPYSYAKKYDLGADPLLSCPVHGQYSARNLLWSERPYSAGSAPLPGYATTQQAVIGDALTDAGVLWFASLINVTAEAGHGSPLSDQSDAAHTIFSNYSQPYTTAVCVHGQVQDGTESKHVTFPLITGVNPPAMATFNTTSSTRHGPEPQQWITHPDFTYSQILDIPADANSYRLRWIPLPGDFFIGSSIGAAVRLPGPDSRTDMLVCNLAASWGPSSIVVEIRGGGIGPMGSAFHTPGNDKKPGIPISQSHIPSAEDYDAPSATPFDNGYLSSRHGQKSINISDSWAQYLDPMIEPLNSSVFDVLMHYTMGNVAGTAQNALVMLVTNGLARTAWGSTLQGDVKTVVSHGEERLDGNYWLSGKGDVFKVDPTLSQDWVTLRVDSTLKGYAYNTLTTPPRIAIALLTAYCLLVVGHTLYSAISGISSNSWDTIAEVVALAINSTPTAALRNTCAGISELYIFKLPVRVLVSKDEEGEGEHLELVLGKVDEEKIRERTIVANRTYGTLPKGVVVDEARKDI